MKKWNGAKELKDYMVEATNRAIAEKQSVIAINLTGEMFGYKEEYQEVIKKYRLEAILNILREQFREYDIQSQVSIVPYTKFLCQEGLSSSLRSKYYGHLDWRIYINEVA